LRRASNARNRNALGHLKKHSLAYYVNKLAQDEPFAISRWNDGEWLTAFGPKRRVNWGWNVHKNSNGCEFSAPLGNKLRSVIERNLPYEHAICRRARRGMGHAIGTVLRECGADIQFWTVSGDIFLESMLKGNLFPLVEQLREKKVGIVGPSFCSQLGVVGFFNVAGVVTPPGKNAINQRDDINRMTLDMIEIKGLDVVGYSAGLHSKVFIDDIWSMTDGDVTLIDFGSMWDGFFDPLPHVNSQGSRSYIRRGRHDFEELRRINANL